uniref:Protein kinase, putative n=1 Tax=Arabidopsis thaliana TaxID=3702 RepID=Q9C7L2_ARATH|nr:protein kinase, putative [Arabidopsis thaliana]
MENKSHSNHHRYHHLSSRSHEQNQRGLISINAIIIIGISIISIFIILAILLIIILLHRLKSARVKAQELSCKESFNNMNNGGASTNYSYTSSPAEGVEVYTYKELEIATNNFSEEKKIGNGDVYKGVLSDGTVAAIKKLHMFNDNASNQKHEERSFRLEVDLLSRLQCPYLVELLGYCADQNHRILIYEFMPNGTVEHHLHDHNFKNLKDRPQPLDWGARLRIALDCARALEFLHENTISTVIHRNFKCTNILLDQNNRAKVSDFGLAKTGSDKLNGEISTRVIGTTGYLAPEYASTGKLTTKSDVYSYGIVLLQLLTGRTPIDSRRPRGQDVLVSWALPRLTNREKISEMVDPTMKGQYSQKDLIQVAAIAAVCVQPEASYRPLMTDVVHSLIPLVKAFNKSTDSSRFPSRRESLSFDDIMP